MPINSLGRIRKLNLREVFPNEASDFTPWLEKNIEQLSEIIGIEISDINKEEGVGEFSADLVATEVNTGDKIIIENQIEQTDHDHLGKLITYASGVGAKYVVWVAKKIREEHQKALEWLNENTDLSFFGVEVEVIAIGNSEPAANFKLIIEPNAWGREIKQTIEKVDDRHKKFFQFYSKLVSEYQEIKPDWNQLTPRPQSWLGFGAGKTGFNFNWSFRANNKFAVELYIDTKDKEEIKNYFNEIKKFSNEINKEIPELMWEELPDSRASRIALYHQMQTPVKNMGDKEMKVLAEWAIEKMDVFKKVFSKYSM